MNTDSEQDEYQDTEVADFNAPEEKPSDSADEVRSTPIHTERQNTTVLVNIDEGNEVQDDADEEDEVAVSTTHALRASRRMHQMMILSFVMLH